MEFTTVNPDGVDEMGEDELREAVSEFEDAQESNIEEFKEAQETLNEYAEFDVSIKEAQEFKQDVLGDVAAASPFTEDELSDFGLSRLRELKAEFAEETEEDEGESEDGEFTDMGTRGETDPEDDGENFSELQGMVENVSGLEFSDE
jgi:hypothetical protein